jgi:hypothetical protein
VVARLQVLDDGQTGIVDIIPFTGFTDLGEAQAIAL